MKILALFFAFFLTLVSLPSSANVSLSSPANSGLVQVKSSYDVEETIKRFNARAVKGGMQIINIISHDIAAKDVNMELLPTRLIIFGSPKVGTALMQCNQTAGIDLPLKALVWQDRKKNVYVTYNDPSFIKNRHSLACCKLPIEKISANLKRLVLDATQDRQKQPLNIIK